MQTAQDSVTEVRKGACWFCYQNCGVEVTVRGNSIERLVGDVSHPASKGHLCPRNFAWNEFHSHPDRLNYPQKREGKRGEGKWKKISWNQAMDEIAQKLKELKDKYGPESVATSGGTNRTDDWARRRFFNLFGSPNTMRTHVICGMNGFMLESCIFGWGTSPDLFNTKLVVSWGHNLGISYMPMADKVWDAKERGAKLMTIDPRLTETSSKSDLWLQIRPGTDAALALAWINVIINEDLYDHQFVEKYTVGFDRLKDHVRQYTPKWAADVTSVPEDKVEESARLYATLKPACILWGVAADHLGRASTAFVHARAILRAITGNLDVEGGNTLLGPGKSFLTDSDLELNDRLSPDQRKKQLGSDRFRLNSWVGWELVSEQTRKYWGKEPSSEWTAFAHPPTVFNAIRTGQPYPVKALLVLANNPLLCYPNTKNTYEALTSENLELLTVMDYWLTPTAMLADYILPAASWVERPVLTTNVATNWFIANERPVQPSFERRTDFEFWRELGLRLGQQEYWPWKNLEEANLERIKGLGFDSYEKFVHERRIHADPQQYRRYEKQGFGTPSGKVELYSTMLERLGYPPMPVYEEPPESPRKLPIVARQFPLILINGNFMPFHHSELRQIRLLRDLAPDPLVEMNPDTARRLGIREGEWANIESKRGKIRMKVQYNIGLDPRVVFAQKGWWFPEKTDDNLRGVWDSNVNVLTESDPERCDIATGGWPYRALLCKVNKAT
jgi:thiosulfate reductase/polysulfide reductase chain A